MDQITMRRSARLQKNIIPDDDDQEKKTIASTSRQPIISQEETTKAPSLVSARGSVSTSATTKRRLVEAQAARQLAEIEEKRLAAKRKTIEARFEEEMAKIDLEEENNSRSSHSRVLKWVKEQQAPQVCYDSGKCEPEDVKGKHYPSAAVQDQCNDDVSKLARAITEAIKMTTSPANYTSPQAPLENKKLLGRLSSSELPVFSGDASDWFRFKKAYDTTTRICHYSAEENVARLQKCLRGEAWEAVAARVITDTSADDIMKTLEMRFGRPEVILHKIISEIKKIPKLSGSRTELIILATKVSNCVAAITATNRSEYLYNTELITEIVNKLTETLVFRWIDYSVTEDVANRPRLGALADYLMREAEHVCRAGVIEMPLKSKTLSSGSNRHTALALAADDCLAVNENSVNAVSLQNPVNPVSFQNRSKRTDITDTQTVPPSCSYCNKVDHALENCALFVAQDIIKRWEWICGKKLCFKCFSSKHRRDRCRSRKQCEKCNRGHHTLLHRNDWLNWNKESDESKNISNGNAVHETTANVWAYPEQKRRVFLKILPVTIEGPAGSINTFALLDEGSTVSLIDSKTAEELGAKGPFVDFNLQGAIGLNQNIYRSRIVSLTLRTPEGSFPLQNVRTVDNLTLPIQKLDREVLSNYIHLQEVPLEEYEGQPLLLVGQDHWQLIISREIKQGRMNEPVASRTMLGWVLHGFVSSSCKVYSEFNNHLTYSEADAELHELVKNYFRIDGIGVKREDQEKLTSDEEHAFKILDSKSRKVGDKWETGLLWRSDKVTLPNNKRAAIKRLMIIEKMMDADPAFAADYSKQVDTLLENKYAEEVSGLVSGNRVWYLPHFGVRNPNKPGKLRLVHDAKAEVKGISLNTELLTGPDLLNSLIGVLFRFRERAVAVTGDIKEMFMRVKMNEEDQMSQLFLWRGMNRTVSPRTFKMTSMIFGAKSSPCTATYIIRRNADEFANSNLRAVTAIKRRHYVDDYLDSADTVEEMKQIVEDVISIHRAGGFEIRGFMSNKPDCVPKQHETQSSVNLFSSENSQRTLGIIWKPDKDVLAFDLTFKKIDQEVANGSRKPTKREMLQVIMSVFDPLGMLSPFLVRGKILLQQLWRSGVQWDDIIGDTFAKTWFDWLRDLKSCVGFCVPRCYCFSALDTFQLHVFVDASEQAYAAVAYLRRVNNEVAFVASKCRVAPLKPITVPRLELQAALMGIRLGTTIQKEQDLEINKRFFWTDSRVVWHWIQNNPHKNKSFVSNRLAEIKEMSDPTEWKWIPGELNVADEATRAKRHTISDLKWITGPDFLKYSEDYWPQITPPVILDENEHTLVTYTQVNHAVPDISRFSKWLRLIRATAYVVLFIERLQNKSRVLLQSRHLDRAEELWILHSQYESFPDDLARVKANLSIVKSSRLKDLSCYIDHSGILRLKGRAGAVQGVDQKMLDPVLLDGRNKYTRLLIHHYHEKAYHGNTESVVNDLRQKYWVIHLRPTVRSIQNCCLLCKIRKARPLQPLTGDLPPGRLAHHKRPFTHCGLDYFGPMTVTIGRRHEKRYGALFTCMTTRAIHLELAGSLTTDSTIMALRRMMSRRGCPEVIYSDNGTNFRGANTELKKVMKELDNDELCSFLTNKRIEWRFNPPLAPHMGGCWERLVRSVKTSLKVVLNQQAPREETLLTLLAEVEHTINSRPLTHISLSESDPEALTPNHFLLGGPSNVPSLGNCELVTRKCWRDAQRLADLFWNRWLREYLPSLIPRISREKSRDIKEGSMVLVADPSLPRNVWPKGIVVKLYPGPDGVCRVADVRTVGGILRRPLTKLLI